MSTHIMRKGDSGAAYTVSTPDLDINAGGAQVLYFPRPVKIVSARVFAAVAVDNGAGTPTYELGTTVGGGELVAATAIADLAQYAAQVLPLTAAASAVSGVVHFTVNDSGVITGTVRLVLEVVNV